MEELQVPESSSCSFQPEPGVTTLNLAQMKDFHTENLDFQSFHQSFELIRRN